MIQEEDLIQRGNCNALYTKKDLICDLCSKSTESVAQVKDFGQYCWFECFYKELPYIFNKTESEFILVRMVTNEAYKLHPAIRKKERCKLNLRLRYSILKRDNFQCSICKSNDRLEIDHIHPISKGGETTKQNLQTLCFKCNRGKHNDG